MIRPLALLFFFSLPLLPIFTVAGDGDCSPDEEDRNKSKARPLKIAAFFSILVCGAIGVCLPILSKSIPALSLENDIFFAIKAFAAVVILATGFIHILPDAFENLTSLCLNDNPWGNFPFAGFGAMLGALGTLMVDTLATSYFTRSARAVGDENNKGDAAMGGSAGDHHVVHVHATRGHAHGPTVYVSDKLERNRVISLELELGIVVHSVIIGISLGASDSPSTISPLVAALSFHQFFEGMGLGGCIAQAKFKIKSMAMMILFFSLTTPVGMAIGFGISSVYNKNSPITLIIKGCLNSVAIGILIYMALVDLLVEEFMNPKVQSKGKLQFEINVSLLIGVYLMSLLAKWA
ncbi:zinc transporter 8-like [Elaeis guineensis]|uniref:Zinc transporter 8-like n=1 Tax=Elaeis guineensis var. tenera TaxID=51953 RepID=A0A6I9R8K4_ELAGV|nr:zinc transporter 8-like [Elaeis guineensis]